MESTSIHQHTLSARTRPPGGPLQASTIPLLSARRGPVQACARALLFGKLESLHDGEITFVDGPNRRTFGRATSVFPLRATVHVHDASVYSDTAFGGTIGSAESFMRGAWSTDDLVALVRIFVKNGDVLAGMEGGSARLAMTLHKLYHKLRDNTLTGSRKNIEAHYDLGNEFYALFLDETMMYSAGIFESEASTLREASVAKIERLCKKLDLRASDHLLEIGTGWGGCAIHAAEHFGCRVTTTTISRRQYEFARDRVRQRGLESRVDVRFEDYRELRGTFDKLISIEMIEAVGHAYYDEFFARCAQLLRRDGVAALQAITIDDRLYERALKNVDFIQRYIFPGSTIPSVTALLSSATRASDLKLFHLEDFTPHYARTLFEWRARFLAQLDRVRALGYDERFIRAWEYYLCYCEGGFAERSIGSVQMVMTRPDSRRAPLLGAL